jgi:hypothetical protein
VWRFEVLTIVKISTRVFVCDAVRSCRWSPAFRRSVPPLSSGLKWVRMGICFYRTTTAAQPMPSQKTTVGTSQELYKHTSWITIDSRANKPINSAERILQKLIVVCLARKCLTLYGTRRLITVFTRVRHRSLYWAKLFQLTHTHNHARARAHVLSLSYPDYLRYILQYHPLICT